MMRFKVGFIWMGLGMFFWSCNHIPILSNDPAEEGILARVDDQTLTASAFEDVVFPKNKADSLALLQVLVEGWVREQLLLQQAEDQLTEDLKAFDQQLENYRKSLLIHAYQERMLASRLDTQLSYQEIEAYYQQNRTDFLLKYNIVQYASVTLPKNHKDASKVRQWLQSDKPVDAKKLMDFCQKYAYGYRLTDTNWVRMDELEQLFPLVYPSQEIFLQRNRFTEVSDSLKTHFIRIHAVRRRETSSPIAFEMGNIRMILLNQKKQQILKQLETELYHEAQANGKFEMYLDK
jgi:hypothetical protein